MKHKINPTVDCVFKAILGSEENKNLLIHFLNAVLEPASLIKEIVLNNPYNEREFVGDKLTVVDVKALDENKWCETFRKKLNLRNYQDNVYG
jgi:predicted transposase/invertase (TIGR01784 family)